MKRLIGLIGFARTGKDTVANHLVRQHDFVRLASGDLVRDVLYATNPWVQVHNVGMYGEAFVDYRRLQQIVDASGWEEAKAFPEVRRLLQELGTEGVRRALGDNVWVEETLRRARAVEKPVVITDCRFPNEAALVTRAGGSLWRILRPGVKALNQHSSETLIDHIKCDFTILNDGTLEDLYARIDAALEATRPVLYDPWPGALGDRHYTGGPLHIDVI